MFLFVLALLALQSKTHKVSIGFCCLAVRVAKDAPKPRQTLKLLLVAARHHLSGQDLRALVQFLEREDLGFEVTLQVADPAQQPELLELLDELRYPSPFFRFPLPFPGDAGVIVRASLIYGI